jgi:putative transposase
LGYWIDTDIWVLVSGSGTERNWSPVGPVTLNPERDSVVAAHLKSIDSQPLAA